jgi:hypothetical protein
MSLGQLWVGQTSVGQMSVGLMFIGLMFVSQMPFSQLFFDQKRRHHGNISPIFFSFFVEFFAPFAAEEDIWLERDR